MRLTAIISRLGGAVLLSAATLLAGPAATEPLAKDLFGAKRMPAAGQPSAFGFYSKGCFSGGVAIATDGPTWQVMRLSRNRMWGHPRMIALIEDLSRKATAGGWPGLLVGDISQPRGGPMLSGHASHQIGLDADIWLTPMPNRRLTAEERENTSATSVLADGGNSLYVDERIWKPAHAELLRAAAAYPEVERLLVHPGIKKKLCDTVSGDRTWLGKVRPFWSHHYHFHIRMACPPGSPGCKGQEKTPPGDGCGSDLAWWFTDEPWKPAKPGTKPNPPARDVMTMASLPDACRAVLAADDGSGGGSVALAQAAVIGSAAPSGVPAGGLPILPDQGPVPEPRPQN
jgi:penicillin-insensitive murein DD-endopeptidase